jgi:hypothetical protein
MELPMPSDTDSRKEVFEFLRAIQSHYAAYHNHKENSAWAGVAFFVAVLAGGATILRDHLSSLRPNERMGLIAVVALLCGVTCFFLREQFRLRKRAADIVAASCRAQTDILSNPSEAIDPLQWQIEQSIDSEMQSSHFLPRRLNTLATELSAQGQGARKALEACAYLLVTLLSIAGAVAIL